MNRITFDFETNEVIIECDGHHGTRIDPELQKKRAAILAAAELEIISGEELRKDINQMFSELGFTNVKCANIDDE